MTGPSHYLTPQVSTAMPRVPLAVALPWFPALMPNLPSNYMECNGQVIDDPESPMNGKTLPNLNNGRYLMGGAVEQAGSAVGSNSVSLATSNLPVANLSGTVGNASAGTPSGTVTTENTGSHSHTVTDPGHSHTTKGSATGLLTGIVGYAMRPDGSGSVASNSATTGITIASGGAHSHNATFSGSALPTHTHTVSVPLNSGSQTPIDNRPASIVVRWIMRIK